MKSVTVFRLSLATLAVLRIVVEAAPASNLHAGSTPEGDYLRGVGIAGWGMGLYNLNTAQADRSTSTPHPLERVPRGRRQGADPRVRGAQAGRRDRGQRVLQAEPRAHADETRKRARSPTARP